MRQRGHCGSQAGVMWGGGLGAQVVWSQPGREGGILYSSDCPYIAAETKCALGFLGRRWSIGTVNALSPSWQLKGRWMDGWMQAVQRQPQRRRGTCSQHRHTIAQLQLHYPLASLPSISLLAARCSTSTPPLRPKMGDATPGASCSNRQSTQKPKGLDHHQYSSNSNGQC